MRRVSPQRQSFAKPGRWGIDATACKRFYRAIRMEIDLDVGLSRYERWFQNVEYESSVPIEAAQPKFPRMPKR